MRLATLGIMAGALASCVSVSSSSVADRAGLPPDFDASPVMVWFPVEDMATLTASEERFLEEADRRGGTAIAGSDALSPDREHSASELAGAARGTGAATILVVSVRSGRDSMVPPNTQESCIQRNAEGVCRPTVGGTSIPRSVPGKLVLEFTLFDTTSESSIWRATVVTTDKAGASTSVDLVERAMEEAVKRLTEDGLLPGRS